MRSLFKILSICFLLTLSIPAAAQLAIEEQSAFLDSVLVNLQNSNDFHSLEILDKQLDIKNQIIEKIKFQIVQIDKNIRNNEQYYNRLNTQLDNDKQIYADLLVKAQMYNSRVHKSFDVFSLDNIYTAYRQFLYLKYLSSLRKKKILSINNLKSEILTVVKDLDSIKSVKASFAEKIGVEESFIRKYTKSRSHIITDMEINRNKYGNNLSFNNLDSIKFKNPRLYDSSSDSSALFEIQKGYLIWPVKKSAIISYFGQKQHPVYDKVTIKNDGLDFCVPADASVFSVYNGTVVKVSLISYNKYVVIVRHGEYYTVYNGLDNLEVEVGDYVEKGDELGNCDTRDNHSILNFQIWKGSENLDPYQWLTKTPDKS